MLDPAARAVADADLNAVTKRCETRLRGLGELLDHLDAKQLGAHLGHHRRLIA